MAISKLVETIARLDFPHKTLALRSLNGKRQNNFHAHKSITLSPTLATWSRASRAIEACWNLPQGELVPFQRKIQIRIVDSLSITGTASLRTLSNNCNSPDALWMMFFFFDTEKAESGHPETAVCARRDATETRRQQNYTCQKKRETRRNVNRSSRNTSCAEGITQTCGTGRWSNKMHGPHCKRGWHSTGGSTQPQPDLAKPEERTTRVLWPGRRGTERSPCSTIPPLQR